VHLRRGFRCAPRYIAARNVANSADIRRFTSFQVMVTPMSALSPDEQGRDRLQWSLDPHEKLKGRTPLEVRKADRKQVIEAANLERWHGRD